MISSHRAIKDEEGRCIAAVKALELIEKKSQDLIVELAEIDWDKKSAEATLDVVERQTEAQHKQLRQVEDELVVARGQIKTLTKKLEKAEKAKEQAEQEGYDVGVVETEEALRAEVSEVCRFYCLQVWNEALDRAGVEAYFALRKAENVYYPQTIRSLGSLGSSSSKADLVSSGTNEGKESPTRALPTANISSKEAKLSEDAKKAANFTKEVARDAALPPSTPKDSSKEKEASQHGDCASHSPHTFKGRTPRQGSSLYQGRYHPISQEAKGQTCNKNEAIGGPPPPPLFFVLVSKLYNQVHFCNLFGFFRGLILMKIAILSFILVMLILIQT